MKKIKKRRCNRCKKTKLIKEFYENKKAKDGYTKVCKMCGRERAGRCNLNEAKRGNLLFLKTSYIYIIIHPLFPEWIKIGQAIDIQKRLSSYQTSDPLRLYIVYFKIKTKAVWYIERVFREYIKSNGYEWYKISKLRAKRIIIKLIKEEIESDQLRIFRQ